MENVEEYILLSKQERQKHLDLNDKCIERGIRNSKDLRGLLAFYLDTSAPKENNIYVCHACHNGECCNPKHIYWGTPKENHDDQVENGTYKHISERTKEKYGLEEYHKMNKAAAAKGGRNGKSNLLSDDIIQKRIKDFHDIKKSWGYIGKLAELWGLTSASAKRFLVKHDLYVCLRENKN